MNLLAHTAWLSLPLALVLAAAACRALIPLAGRIGLVDHPNPRKMHERPTPMIGGLAIAIAVGTTAVLVLPGPGSLFTVAVLGGAAALLVVGMLDDVHELSPLARLLTQAGACLWVIQQAGVQLGDFGQLFSADVLNLGWLAVPITVFAAMGVINAFNLIDGMDGLSGTVFLIAAAGMALFARLAGQHAVLLLLLIASGAVLGFLVFNARWPWNPRARTFLGDSGALLLGFLLAWCAIRLGSGADRAYMPMTAVWLVAVPLLDTSTMIWMRWREGRSAASADQRHLHHAFLRAGFSVPQAWVGIALLALLLAGIGVGFEVSGAPGYVSFYTFITLAFAYYLYVRHAWATQRFLGRHFLHHDFEIDESLAWPTGTGTTLTDRSASSYTGSR